VSEFLEGLAATTATLTAGRAARQAAQEIVLVPNFHPASCGWLANFDIERLYFSNSYLDHHDRVGDDPSYKCVPSEMNNIIGIMNFHPKRVPGLKQRLREGLRASSAGTR